MDKQRLIEDLIEQTRKNLNQVEAFIQLDSKELNFKKSEESWSILECIAHLNIYSDFYHPEIEKSIGTSKSKNSLIFKPGVLGNYFVKIITPSEKQKKMKTMEKFNRAGSRLSIDVLEKFKSDQFVLLDLLSKCHAVNLTKNKTAVSINKMIKLRLGDTLRFVIAHNQRHLIQAQNVLNQIT